MKYCQIPVARIHSCRVHFCLNENITVWILGKLCNNINNRFSAGIILMSVLCLQSHSCEWLVQMKSFWEILGNSINDLGSLAVITLGSNPKPIITLTIKNWMSSIASWFIESAFVLVRWSFGRKCSVCVVLKRLKRLGSRRNESSKAGFGTNKELKAIED